MPSGPARIGIFSGSVRLSPAFSDDTAALLRLLPDSIGSNFTRLYDAVLEVLHGFEADDRRHVIVIFSDGADTASSADLKSVTSLAARGDVMIYGIGLNSRYQEGPRSIVRRPDPALRELAEQTGGGYFDRSTPSSIAGTFDRIVSELRQQYLLAFSPAPPDGRTHTIQVRVVRPGLSIHARRTYLASP